MKGKASPITDARAHLDKYMEDMEIMHEDRVEEKEYLFPIVSKIHLLLLKIYRFFYYRNQRTKIALYAVFVYIPSRWVYYTRNNIMYIYDNFKYIFFTKLPIFFRFLGRLLFVEFPYVVITGIILPYLMFKQYLLFKYWIDERRLFILDSIFSRKYTHFPRLEAFWTVMPILIIIAILIPSLTLLYAMEMIHDADVSIKVTGHQWYWEYEYSKPEDLRK